MHMEFSISLQNLSLFEQLIAALFVLSAVIHLLYYFIVFSKLAFYKGNPEKHNGKQQVSIIIAAHNEDYNL